MNVDPVLELMMAAEAVISDGRRVGGNGSPAVVIVPAELIDKLDEKLHAIPGNER